MSISYSVDQFRAEAEVILDDVRDAFREAWRIYTMEVEPRFPSRPPRKVRATNVQALIVQLMRNRFPDRVRERRGMWTLRVNDRLHLNFKLLDREGLPRCTPTKRAQAFYNSNSQGSLLDSLDVPQGNRVTVGYQVDSEGVELAGVFAVYMRALDRAHWRYTLSDGLQQTLDFAPRESGVERKTEEGTSKPKLRLAPKADAKPGSKKSEG